MTTPPTDEQLADWLRLADEPSVGWEVRDALLQLPQEVRRLRNVNGLMVSEHDDDLADLRGKLEKAEAERDEAKAAVEGVLVAFAEAFAAISAGVDTINQQAKS